MTPTRRAYLAATGTLAAALAGCSSGTDPGANDSAGANETSDAPTNASANDSTPTANGSVLRFALPSKLDSLDPISGTAFGNGYVQLYEGLMTFPNGDTEPKHALSTGHEVSDDRKTYTFDLKRGVSFHNGKTLTAGDFVYSWKRLAGSKNSNNANNIIGDTFSVKHDTTDGEYVPDSLAVSAVDDHTFRFELDEPFPSTLSLLADPSLAAIPEGIVGDIEGYSGRRSYERFANNPVGTGPFEFGRWNSGTEVALSAFADYHGTGPALDGLHWQVLPDTSTRYNSATAGNLDVFTIPTARFDPEKVSIEETKPDGRKLGTYGPVEGTTLRYGRVPNLTTQYITLNTQRVDRPARRAIAYVLNQQQVLKQAFKGLGTPAYFITPKAVFPGGSDAYEKLARAEYPYGYDESRIDAATRVMERAGYSEDDPYEAEFTIYENSGWKRVATLLRDQLGAAHIDLSVQQVAFSTVLTRAGNGKLDMFSFADSLEWPEADNLLRYLHPSAEGFSRWSGTNSAKRAESAWQDYLDNRGSGRDARSARTEAYRTIEQANWDAVAELPIRHGVRQRFWYDWAEVPMFGPMLSQQYTTAELETRS